MHFHTLCILHTLHFPHSTFSILLIFHNPRFPYSSLPALRTPHSALRTPPFPSNLFSSPILISKYVPDSNKMVTSAVRAQMLTIRRLNWQGNSSEFLVYADHIAEAFDTLRLDRQQKLPRMREKLKRQTLQTLSFSHFCVREGKFSCVTTRRSQSNNIIGAIQVDRIHANMLPYANSYQMC